MATVERRCFATAACTSSITLSVEDTGNRLEDRQALRLLLEANGWDQGLHGWVCPQHRTGTMGGGG